MPRNNVNSNKRCCRGCKMLSQMICDEHCRQLGWGDRPNPKCQPHKKISNHGKPTTKKSVKCLYKKMVSPLLGSNISEEVMKEICWYCHPSRRSDKNRNICRKSPSPHGPCKVQTLTKVTGRCNIRALVKNHHSNVQTQSRTVETDSNINVSYNTPAFKKKHNNNDLQTPPNSLDSSIQGGQDQDHLAAQGDINITQKQINDGWLRSKLENIGNFSHRTACPARLKSPSEMAMYNNPHMKSASKISVKKHNPLQLYMRRSVEIDQLMDRLDRIHKMERRAACMELCNFKQTYCKGTKDETKVLNEMIQKGVSYNAIRLQLDLMEAEESAKLTSSVSGSQYSALTPESSSQSPILVEEKMSDRKKAEEITELRDKQSLTDNNPNQIKVFRNNLHEGNSAFESAGSSYGTGVNKYTCKNADGQLIIQAEFSDGNYPVIMKYYSTPENKQVV